MGRVARPYRSSSVSDPRPVTALAAALALALAGCGDSASPPDAAPVDVVVDCTADLTSDAAVPDPTFANVQAFFTRRCAAGASCHGAGGQGSLTLLGPSLYADLVGHPSAGFPALPRVTPGLPERSFLWLKIDGCFAQLPGCSDPNGPCGRPMPTLSPISEGFVPAEAAVVRAWIVAGAPR